MWRASSLYNRLPSDQTRSHRIFPRREISSHQGEQPPPSAGIPSHPALSLSLTHTLPTQASNIEAAVKKLSDSNGRQEFLRLSSKPTPQQLERCRSLLADGAGGLTTVKHAANGMLICQEKNPQPREFGPAKIRNILCAALQTRGPIGDIAAAPENSAEGREAEEELRHLEAEAKRGDADAFVARLKRLGIDVSLNMEHPAWENRLGWAEPLLFCRGHCPMWEELMFAHKMCPLLTAKFARALAAASSPSRTFIGGSNTNASCARFVSGGTRCNCFPHNTMPAGVQNVSARVANATYDLLLSAFPGASLLILQFGDVRHQGAARDTVMATQGGRLLRFAAPHISTSTRSFKAVIGNFAGAKLLHESASNPKVKRLADLGPGVVHQAVADGVRALTGAADFKRPTQPADGKDLEAKILELEAAVGQGEAAVEAKYEALSPRLGWGSFTDKNSSDGGIRKLLLLVFLLLFLLWSLQSTAIPPPACLSVPASVTLISSPTVAPVGGIG